MHAAAIDSPRLQSVLAFLRQRGEHGATTREIIDATGSCAVNSIVSEIRYGGIAVDCQYEGMTASRARVYRYRLTQPGGSR